MNYRAKYLLILFFLSLFAGYDLLAVAASSHRKKERLSEYVNPEQAPMSGKQEPVMDWEKLFPELRHRGE